MRCCPDWNPTKDKTTKLVQILKALSPLLPATHACLADCDLRSDNGIPGWMQGSQTDCINADPGLCYENSCTPYCHWKRCRFRCLAKVLRTSQIQNCILSICACVLVFIIKDTWQWLSFIRYWACLNVSFNIARTLRYPPLGSYNAWTSTPLPDKLSTEDCLFGMHLKLKELKC